MNIWNEIKCPKSTLQLIPTLLGGQSFRWKQTSDDEFIGVFNDAVWQLKQTKDLLLFKTHRNANNKVALNDVNEDAKILRQYLRLDVNLKELYKSWAESDAYFKEAAQNFFAIRILQQDIIENLFAFICSSNNNIVRISSMVEKLSEMFGEPITTVNGKEYHSFPAVEKLTSANVEKMLRKAGFGYRAKFIFQTANTIEKEHVDIWKKKIKVMPYNEAKESLMKLSGIGAKVADCICLMSLNHLQAIPVDTHIFQIASKRYLPHLKEKKSVTQKVYNEIGDHFRKVFPKHAGWAHTILFCAELKALEGPRSKKSKKTEQSTETMEK